MRKEMRGLHGILRVKTTNLHALQKNPFFIGTWSKLPIKNIHLTKMIECILNVGVFCLTAQVESKKPK